MLPLLKSIVVFRQEKGVLNVYSSFLYLCVLAKKRYFLYDATKVMAKECDAQKVNPLWKAGKKSNV